MICKIHNLVVRIGNCPKCEKEKMEIYRLDVEIERLEKELAEPIILWEGGR